MALTDNIVAYYKFDENTGTNVADSVATFAGTWTGTLGSQWTTGIINSGGQLNGTDNYVTAGSKSLGLGTSISLSLWIKATTLTSGNYYCWFSFGGFIANGFILQREGGTNKLRFAWNGTDYYDGPVFSTTGSWVHLVVTVSGGVPQFFYVNNVSTAAARSVGSGTFSTTDPQVLELGRRGDNTQLINGLLDEVGLWNRTLSDTEITSLYNSGAGFQYPFSTGSFGSMVSTLSFAGSLKTM